MTADGGGWTLVWSYIFANYASLNSSTNAVTPFPTWSVQGDIQVRRSTKVPLNETDCEAMDSAKWNTIGSEFLIKSNINNWLSCKGGSGTSLVLFQNGPVTCNIVKRVTSTCQGVSAPDYLYASNYLGPSLLLLGKMYYHFDGNEDMEIGQFTIPVEKGDRITYTEWYDPHGNIYIC